MRRGWHRRTFWAAVAAGTASALAVAFPAAATDTTVNVGSFKYTPAMITIDQGDTVTWNWVGPDTIHTVTSDAGQADSFDSDPNHTFAQPPGGTYSHKFLTPGTFTYFCRIHSFMHGTVVVNAAQTPPEPTPQTVPGVTPQAVAPKPSFKECISQRNFGIRLRETGGVHLASASVTVNGKPAPVKALNVNGRRRLTAQVDLRGLPKGQYQVQITARTRDGRTLHGTRRYTTCSPRIPSYFPPNL